MAQQGIQTIELAYGILVALEHAGRPMALKEVASAVGMSPSKARMYLVSLLRSGLAFQDEETGKYALGPSLVRLGFSALNSVDPVQLYRQVIVAVASRTGSTCMLNAWSEGGVVIVARNQGYEDVPLDFRVGGHVSLTRTATGRVFLACLPPQTVEARLAAELEENKTNKSTRAITREFLAAECATIRQRGYALASDVVFGSGVTLTGFGAVVYPVLDTAEQLRFVITALFRKSTKAADEAAIDMILAQLRQDLPRMAPRRAIAG